MMKRIYLVMLILLGCIPQLKAQDEAVSVIKYEYWLDTDFDNRETVNVTANSGEKVSINLEFNVSNLSEGVHYIYMRAMNSKNEWGNICDTPFYIDREAVTSPALKDIRKYRYMFDDGTIKYVDLATPSQSIAEVVYIDMPDMYIDKSLTTFEFGMDANPMAVVMNRNLEYNFALQYENDQNGWCPPVQQRLTEEQKLPRTAMKLMLDGSINIDKPFKGNYVPFTFTLNKAGRYALKSSDGINVLLFKQSNQSAEGEDGAKWVNFAEVSPQEMLDTYIEDYDTGRIYGIVYTPERYDDGKAATPDIMLMRVCETPDIMVNGTEVTIGGFESGVTYYYTLDGSEPTTASTVYTAPFTVADPCIVKAIAVKDGQVQSSMAVASVTLNQGGGDEVKTYRVDAKFEKGVLTLSCDADNAMIYYGFYEYQNPDRLYSGPVQLTDNRPVYYYARIPGQGNTPTDKYEPAYFKCQINFSVGRDICISSPDEDRKIYYTTDGTEPTNSGNYSYGDVYLGYEDIIKAFVTAPYKLNSDTVTFTPDAMYRGDIEPTYVNVPGKLAQAYEWMKTSEDTYWISRSAKMIRVKGTVNYDDIAYIQQMKDLEYIDLSEADVVERSLPDNVFAGMNIRYFCSPRNLTSVGSNILAGCKRLGGIKWNSKIAVPEDILGGEEYPNLMLYVKSASYANGNIFHNVISNGVAANITLRDADERGCFYAIDQFRAQKISYTRHFGMETLLNGESQGWETLALPFNVQTVTHETNGECLPFAYGDSDTDKRFWLNVIDAKEFPASSNRPRMQHQYIVSMPNNVDYSDEYILGGNVTFSARNTDVYATNTILCYGIDSEWGNYGKGEIDRHDYTDLDSVRIYSNYEYLEPSEQRSTINAYEAYDGHNPGSIFVPGAFGCKPFEAYIEYVQDENRAPRRGPVIGIGDGTTGIQSIPVRYADDNVYSKDGKLYIYSDAERDMTLYNIMGRKVKTVHLQVGENVIEGLPVGTYIVKGKKFMINYKR